MNWSKEHLEARMLDAIEGRLSNDQLIQLQQFLQEHPEFGTLNDAAIFIQEDASVTFDYSFLLKKDSFNPIAYSSEEGLEKEKMSIARMEGLLSSQEEKEFELMLNVDQELIDQWQLVQQTKLVPNAEIRFPSLEILKKEIRKGKVIPFRMYFSYVAAASVILVLFLNWPSPENHVKTASKTTQRHVKVEPKKTKSQVADSYKTNFNVIPKPKNLSVEDVEIRQNELRDCIVELWNPEVEQITSETSSNQTQPIVDPIELATISPKATVTPTPTNIRSKTNETIGIREFMLQKGNEKLFGSANPSTAEKYSSITNYLAQSVNIPISYLEKEDEQVKTTFFKLGFITVERKQTKK